MATVFQHWRVIGASLAGWISGQRDTVIAHGEESERFDGAAHMRSAPGLTAVVACCVLLAGCQREDAPAGLEAHGEAPVTSVPARPARQEASTTGHATRADEPAHPPIDCPLRKQGIDPSHMRPFEEVERYIAFLERTDRAAWQKPGEVIAALGLAGDEIVVDLGAGSGYFTFRLAGALPRGRVIAADIEPEMIRHIHHKAMTERVRNVEATLVQADEPAIPTDVDLVFVCDVLHHVSDRPAWLSSITKAMRSGAKLVLIEFKEGNLPEGPPESVKISRDRLVALVTEAGLDLDSERADLLPYQSFLVFRKP